MARKVNPADFIGKRYGHLTIVRYSHHNGKHPFYEFQCDCGETFVHRISDVMRQHDKSCRGEFCRFSTKPKKLDPNKFIGTRVGHLTAIKYLGQNKNKYHIYQFRCDCGNVITERKHDVLIMKDPTCEHESCTCVTSRKQCMRRIIARRKAKDCTIETPNTPIEIISHLAVLPGMVFGLLTAKENIDAHNTQCKCSCGREVIVKNEDLISKKRVSCMNEFCKHNPRGFKKYEKQVELISYYHM